MRRSRRRTGQSCCRRARPTPTNRREKRSPFLAKRIGRRSTHSFGAAAIRRPTRKISSRGFSSIYFKQNTLSRADREKGRLRTFLLGSLQNFLLKQRERMSAMKRGGGRQIVSFDDQLIDAEAAMNATAHLSDVSSYDLAWASSVVTRAWKNVRERFAAEGKREWVDELRPFVAGGTATAPNQEEVAKRLGTSVENFRVSLSRLRQTYRHALRAEVASTVSDPKDIDDELHYVYQILTA